MWQLKMLFALGAVCFKLTVRSKLRKLQICFREKKKPFGVQGFVCSPCRLKRFDCLGSIPSFWWVMDQWRAGPESPSRLSEWVQGEEKSDLMKILFVFPAGSPYYDNVRPLSYPDSDAVLICFDISRPETLDSVLKKASVWAQSSSFNPCTGNFHFVSRCSHSRSFVWKGWVLIGNKNSLMEPKEILIPQPWDSWGWCEELEEIVSHMFLWQDWETSLGL